MIGFYSNIYFVLRAKLIKKSRFHKKNGIFFIKDIHL